jgi:hypothetical protein
VFQVSLLSLQQMLHSVVRAEVGDKIAGTNVGASAKITAISVGATNTTFTVDVANSGTVGTNTLTVTPVTRVFSTIVCGQQAMAQAVAEEPTRSYWTSS